MLKHMLLIQTVLRKLRFRRDVSLSPVTGTFLRDMSPGRDMIRRNVTAHHYRTQKNLNVTVYFVCMSLGGMV